jgi:Leucine-rich repeat (LRR) protein
MENYKEYIPQLRQMLLNGSEDNITLALEIAGSMNLIDDVMLPFRRFWSLLSATRKSDSFIISKLSNISYMNLENKRLRTLPEAIFMMTKIEHLLLGNNELETIPAEIVNLTNLVEIDLNNNRFSVFPDNILALKNLKILSIYRNELTVLPNDISKLKNLEHLFFADNSIEEIPTSIAQLTNLTTINLNDNQIRNFPAEIAQMTSLHAIFIENNKLKNFPVVSLSLRDLNISRNKFDSTPEVLLNENKLDKLDISFNPGFVWNLNKVKMSRLNYIYFAKSTINRFNAVNNLTLTKFYDERNQLAKVFDEENWPENFGKFLFGMKENVLNYDEYADCEDGWWLGHPDEDYYMQQEHYYGYSKEEQIRERFMKNERLKCVRA